MELELKMEMEMKVGESLCLAERRIVSPRNSRGGFPWSIPVLSACHLATRQATHLLHDQSETLFNELDLTTAKPQSLA